MTDEKIWNKALHTWSVGADALARLSSTVDRAAFSETVHLLAECRGRIVTAGLGTSAAAARKIAHSLSCIERPSYFLSPGDAVHGGLGAVQPGDVAILISKGGGTSELLNIIPALQTKSVPIVGVTEKPESPLGQASRVVLKVCVPREADEFNMLATTSTMAVIAVFDAICIALMEYTAYTREQFAVIHPGGAVGHRLLKGEGA
ncbi:MAG TPA: SIS domain-containing protein [Spirochaetia bacterium]|nr:SIS domain-containing protein [Spirochaetia bacterium]